MKKQLYKWHRLIGIIVALPVIFWILSGLLHPVMGWIKPQVAKRSYTPALVNLSSFEHSLTDVLKVHNLSNIQNAHVITHDSVSYYQIKQKDQLSFLYINTNTAEISKEVEHKYVEFLARHYSGDQSSKLKSISVITEFSTEYKSVNRLLPAFRVEFDRADGYVAFIDVESARLGGVLDNNRYYFNVFFEIFHNFSLLSDFPNFKLMLILLLSAGTLFSGISGIYIYGFTRESLGERAKLSNEKRKSRNRHRLGGISFSSALLLFSFSGAYHALKKADSYDRLDYSYEQSFSVDDLETLTFPKKSTNYMNLVKIDSLVYVQTLGQKGRKQTVQYFNGETELKNGDSIFAKEMALQFSGFNSSQIKAQTVQKKFTGEYGFINKRLPIHKVSFDVDGDERYYVETRSGKLGAKVQNSDIYEGLSFAYLHKYHMFDFLGKNIRNVIMMCFALGNLLAILFGLKIALEKRQNRSDLKKQD